MDPRLQNVVPPVGTCAGKATLVDVSEDPVRHYIEAAIRALPQTDKRFAVYPHLYAALEEWGR